MTKNNPRIHLFNPENDLALALGCRHYTPPPHAAQLHRAGALLPVWWADGDDTIIAPAAYGGADAAWLRSEWGLEARLWQGPEAGKQPGHASTPSPTPWGWSEDARRQFMAAGVGADALPTSEAIAALRMLSHRRSTVAILSGLGRDDLLPEEVTDPARVLQLEAEEEGRFLKSPWSCSGRGVFCARGLPPKVLADKAAGIIHRQGSVMVEHGMEKVAEFGALYECRPREGARFRGFSMFLTEPRGAYLGNIVAPQDHFLDRISSLGLLSETETATRQLEGVVTQLLGGRYAGWLGIDMMAYADRHGTTRLHPCIEMNLRMTMGVVAMKIAERLAPTRPQLMAWQRTSAQTTPAGSTLLLPPREGFALSLV